MPLEPPIFLRSIGGIRLYTRRRPMVARQWAWSLWGERLAHWRRGVFYRNILPLPMPMRCSSAISECSRLRNHMRNVLTWRVRRLSTTRRCTPGFC